MSHENEEVPSGHVYDGIQEYDNPLPGWWVWIFWATIAYAAVYVLYFHGTHPDSGVQGEYRLARGEDQKRADALMASMKPDAPTLFKLMADPAGIERGKTVFKTNCAACHGPEGQGLVGPNLTDESYKVVRTIADIPKVIAEGSGNGTMPPWKTILSMPDQLQVAAFVASLRGKGLPGPRPAEGEAISAWKTP